MAPRSITDAELLERLTHLFRSVGYAAASLSVIAAATGLQKSSLYGRFPGGKEQMAADVATHVIENFATHLLAPLATDGPLRQRLEMVAANLADFYADGKKYCLLDTMTIGDPGSVALQQLSAGAAYWIEAFAGAAREAGADSEESTVRAKDAVAAIEGALVLARVTNDTDTFRRALANLPRTLLGPAHDAPPMIHPNIKEK
jgi:AcrR family transcriptional regulator